MQSLKGSRQLHWRIRGQRRWHESLYRFTGGAGDLVVAGGLTPHGTTPSSLEYALSLLKEEVIPLNSLPGWTSSLAARTDLLKSTKETVSESFAKLTLLAETTRDLRQRSEDVQGAAQQLTSALRSPNVKGQWGR